MIDHRLAIFTAASNGKTKTSRSSRGGMWAGAQFMPPSDMP